MVWIGVGCLVLSVLLMQCVRVFFDQKRVRRARQYLAALKEFKELCGFSAVEVGPDECTRRVRRILCELEGWEMNARFAHEEGWSRAFKRMRLHIQELTQILCIKVKIERSGLSHDEEGRLQRAANDLGML